MASRTLLSKTLTWLARMLLSRTLMRPRACGGMDLPCTDVGLLVSSCGFAMDLPCADVGLLVSNY